MEEIKIINQSINQSINHERGPLSPALKGTRVYNR